MIYYIPLEHLDKRYTVSMDTQIERELAWQKKEWIRIDGEILGSTISVGAFLDANSTNYYKFSQLQKICQLFAQDKIKDGDTFFFSDLWFPGIESLPYMAFFNKKKIYIKGILHAGSYTETDYVAAMKYWAADIERGWIKFCDQIFVGSLWAKEELLLKERVDDDWKVVVTGMPFDVDDCYALVKPLKWSQKEDIVVFNGRLDSEKQPWIFDWLKLHFQPRIRFIKTMEQNLSKKEYYKLLAKTKVVVSFALQENYGYGIMEACAYGCNIVVPDRLSYMSLYPEYCRYHTPEQIIPMTDTGLRKKPLDELLTIAKQQKHNVQHIVENL